MTGKLFLIIGLGGLGLAAACRSGQNGAATSSPDSGVGPSPGSDAGSPSGGSDAGTDPGGGSDAGTRPGGGSGDPGAGISFIQVGRDVGINRSTEPASAGPFNSTNTLAYGSWLADLDGDGRLDYYAVNHGQTPHLAGLFINNGTSFGRNLFTVSLQPSPVNPPNMGFSNELSFVGDLTGDGRVDFFFKSWSGLGVMCANRGPVQGPDWSGPGYTCFGTSDALAFADVNGDGRIDVLAVAQPFSTYAAYYAHTGPYVWRLNNGTPNIA